MFALVTSTAKGAPSGILGVTTDPIDTTGATLLVVAFHGFNGASRQITDSQGHTWIEAVLAENGTGATVKIFYVLNPVTSAAHTVSVNAGNFPSVEFMAYSGAAAASVLDGVNGGSAASGTSLSSGSVTPSEDGCLVISALTLNLAGAPAVSGGALAIAEQVTYASGSHMDGALASEIQAIATARTASWTWSGSSEAAAAIAVFKSDGLAAQIQGSAVFGVTTTVKSTRSMAIGLDGNTNVLNEAGKLKVFGNFEVTGDVTMADPSNLFNSLLLTEDGALVMDENGNPLFSET